MQGEERIMNKHEVIVVTGMEYDIFYAGKSTKVLWLRISNFLYKNNHETGSRVLVQSYSLRSGALPVEIVWPRERLPEFPLNTWQQTNCM